MDISAMSMAMSQINTQYQVGMAVFKMGMESVEGTTNNMVEMMNDMAKDIGVGTNIDVTV